jgi:hypothetical protein
MYTFFLLKGGSPIPPVSSEASPSSSSAPSPTDQQMSGAMDDRSLPRPIGTGSAHKKPGGGVGFASGGDQQGGMWAYPADMGREWIRDSSVMTTSVVASAVPGVMPGTVIVPGVGADGEEIRPASHPGMNPHMLSGPHNFNDPAVIDALEQNFQVGTKCQEVSHYYVLLRSP